jgi:hypothetical protein
MRRQSTAHLLMVRPANFGFNPETANSNAFQTRDNLLTPEQIQTKALEEFSTLVKCLRREGLNIVVARDSAKPVRTDAVFPNNWVTFHQEALTVTYPMLSPNRRRERRRQIIEQVIESGFESKQRINLEFYEKIDRFLEGTGSVVFDHVWRIAYACISPRTDTEVLKDLCENIDYRPIVFKAVDAKAVPVYHTNVLLSVGEQFVVVCWEAIPDPEDVARLEALFRSTNKSVVPISLEQMSNFAGNVLEVCTKRGEQLLLLSTRAFEALNEDQKAVLGQYVRFVHSPIPTIEQYGGGSVRCMLAEIFLPKTT